MTLRKLPMTADRQRGFLIPLAAIIIVGIAVLALTMSRFSSQSGVASVQEGLSVQAFYAAESGAQLGMGRVFYNADTRAQTDGNCAALSGTSQSFSATGLSLCSTSLQCSVTTNASDTTSFYTITSSAQCGAGQVTARRAVAVSAWMD